MAQIGEVLPLDIVILPVMARILLLDFMNRNGAAVFLPVALRIVSDIIDRGAFMSVEENGLVGYSREITLVVRGNTRRRPRGQGRRLRQNGRIVAVL